MILTGTKISYPIYQYKLNESTGTTSYDIGTRKTNIINSNATVAQTGDRGLCYSFNGTTSHVTDSGVTVGDFERTDSFSVTGRFKTSSAGTIVLCSKILSGGLFTGWDIYLSGGQLVFLLIANAGTANYLQRVSSTNTFADGYWHSFCVTYSGTSTAAGVTLYADGRCIGGTNTLDSLSSSIITTASFSIGSRDGAARFFSGTIQDIRLFNRVLTSDEVENISYYGYYQGIFTNPNKKLLLYNTMEGTSQVNNSFVGKDGIEVSAPAYEAAKFGNGFRVGSYAVNDRIYFPFTSTTTIMYDFWWKSKVISSGRSGETNFLIAILPTAGVNTPGTINFVYDGTNERWRLQYYPAAGSYNVYYDYTFADETLMHIRLIMSSSALTEIGGDKIALYIDGVRLVDTDGDGETNAISANISGTIHLGNYHAAQRGMKGIIDNFKYFNYANTNFNDIEIEHPILINGTNMYTTPLEQCIFWSTLHNPNACSDTEIGVNGVVTGGSFTAGKFKDGFRSDANTEYIDFAGFFQRIFDTGSIELWIVPKNTFDDGGTNRCIWMSVGADMSLIYDATANNWAFNLRAKQATFSDTAVPDGTPIHILCSWDNIAGNSVRIFVDGVEGTPGTGTFSTLTDTTLRIGNNDTNNSFASAVLDNLRAYNYTKTTAFDRNVQEPIDLKKVVTQ